MNPYLKTICRDLGLLLHIPGAMALISVLVSLAWGEVYAVRPFIVTAIVTFVTGQVFYQQCKQPKSLKMRHAMAIAALGWLILPLFAAIPFLMIATKLAAYTDTGATVLYFQKPWNAVFEAFSGFSSAGLTMAIRASELPHCLQWWRSLMQWVGGVGVIVLVLSVLEPSTDPYQLYSAEGRSKTIGLTVRATVRKIWWIYILYTIASIMLLRVAGMGWWDALNHGMAGISTGGFSTQDDNLGSFAPSVQIAAIPIMILGAVSFAMHYQVLRYGNIGVLWKNTQHRALVILLLLGTLLLLLANYSLDNTWLWRDTIFQWASALGTCGFGSTDLKGWSDSAKLLLTMAMFIGGTAGSTVGGIKLERAVVLYKAILWRFQRLKMKPHQMMRFKLNGEVLTEAEASHRVEGAAVLALLWLGMVIVGIFVLLQLALPAHTLIDVIFEVTSALGSVGLSTGITSPSLQWPGKLALIMFMWMGRLEIIPVLVLISACLKPFAIHRPASRRLRNK